MSAVVAGVHLQACADTGCTGCYPQPPPVRTSRARNPRADGLSADAARTKANRERLGVGVHPATDHVLLVGCSETCGTCAHHHAYRQRPGKVWHKCDLHRLGQSHSAASDIRVSWPACSAYERREGEA